MRVSNIFQKTRVSPAREGYLDPGMARREYLTLVHKRFKGFFSSSRNFWSCARLDFGWTFCLHEIERLACTGALFRPSMLLPRPRIVLHEIHSRLHGRLSKPQSRHLLFPFCLFIHSVGPQPPLSAYRSSKRSLQGSKRSLQGPQNASS